MPGCNGHIGLQLYAKTGSVTYYLAPDTFPSEAYYESMTFADTGKVGAVFIPKPSTPDADGIVFCNIKGDDNDETNVDIITKPGGEYTNTSY